MASLNREQQQAVDHGDGQLLVLAVPGAGKTRVLVHRVAKLLERGVRPETVCLMTFTKKAAAEMRDRLGKLVGPDAEKINASTFHSFAFRLLKEHLNGGWKEFGVVDDARRPIGKIIRELKLKLDPQDCASNIMLAQQRLLTPDVYAEIAQGDIRRSAIATVYHAYQRWKWEEHKLDYGDFVPLAIQVLEQPEKLVLTKARCKHLLIDEGHDLGYDQLQLLYRLVGSNGNVTMVCDPDQTIYCVSANSTVEVEGVGATEIYRVMPGQRVKTRGANLRPQFSAVTAIRNTQSETARRVTLASGVTLDMTKAHRIYASAERVTEGGVWFTYLMWRNGYGFRTGITKGGQRVGRHAFHYRANSERADRLWILATWSTEEEALLDEVRTSLRYGIPTQIFQCDRVRSTWYLDNLYGEFGDSGVALLRDRQLDFAFPTWSPWARDGKRGGTQRRVRLKPYVGQRDYKGYGVTLEARGAELQRLVERGGFQTFTTVNRRRGTSSHRVQRVFKHYLEAREFGEKLTAHLAGHQVPVILDDGYQAGGVWFRLMLAANLVPGMLLDTEHGPERIMTVDEVPGGEFVDIEVPETGNFYVNGILSHNSFRGSDIRHIDAFRHQYPRHRMITLGENHRSTPEILRPALALIQHNTNRIDKPLTTRNPSGAPVEVTFCPDTDNEAKQVVQQIARDASGKWGDCAILYRCNAQSLAIESALFEAEIPYSTVGKPFFELSEVKLLLAYLRLVRNPMDDAALKMVLNVPPRYLGPEFQNGLQTAATEGETHLYQALDFYRPPRHFQSQKAMEFKQLIETLRYLSRTRSPAQLLREVRGPGGFDAWLTAESDDEPDNERARNIDELCRVAERWTTTGEFLQHVMAVTKASKGKGNRAHMLTLHRSKGLEFPHVWLIGMTDGVLPHEKATWAPGGEEEERRLCYVGMTRAMQSLHLSVPERVWSKSSMPSRFLYEAGLLVE